MVCRVGGCHETVPVGYGCGNQSLERTEAVSADLSLCLTVWLGMMQEQEGMWMPQERLRFLSCFLTAVLQCLVTHIVCIWGLLFLSS